MRVGIDCLRIDPAFCGGLNTFTRGLLKGFGEQRNGHTFHVYMSERNQEWFAKLRGQPGFKWIVLEHQNRAWRKAACGAGLLLGRPTPYEWINDFAHGHAGKKMHDECDVIYTPTVMLRYFGGNKPTVLSMHDLQHMHYPEFFSYARRLSRKVTYGASARRASYLQASSRYTKSDLLGHF